MTKELTTAELIAKFDSPYREVAEVLHKKGFMVLDGYELHIRLSQPFALPKLEKCTYRLQRNGNRGSIKGHKMFMYTNHSIICFSKYFGREGTFLEGYSVFIEGKVPHANKPSVLDPVFKQMRAEKDEHHKWNIGGQTVPHADDKGAEIDVTYQEAIKYAFFLFSHLSKPYFMGNPDVYSNIGRLTKVDKVKEGDAKVDNIALMSEAYEWVKNLSAERLKVLQNNVCRDIPSLTSDLGRATTKDAISTQLKLMCQSNPQAILKWKAEVGEIETPPIAAATAFICDAHACKVLEYDREYGILICQAIEDKFRAFIKPITVGTGAAQYPRLQLFEAQKNIVSNFASYMAANQDSPIVAQLQKVISDERLVYNWDTITPNSQTEFMSARKANGVFAMNNKK